MSCKHRSFVMLAFLLLVKLFAVFVLAHDRNESLPTEQTRRVYYGDMARIEDYPYFAGLWNCGAVILSATWVATAAHCVDSTLARGPQNVYVGGNTMKDSLALSYIDYIIHPEYQGGNGGMTLNDIALLRLNTPLQFSERIQPAKLPMSVAPKNVVLVSRGRDETGIASRHLKKVDRIVLSAEDCISMMKNRNNVMYALQNRKYLEKVVFCTKRQENLPSVCDGDSGSPVLSGNTLIGLHAVGSSICKEGRLGIHTYVLNFVPWIRSHTGL